MCLTTLGGYALKGQMFDMVLNAPLGNWYCSVVKYLPNICQYSIKQKHLRKVFFILWKYFRFLLKAVKLSAIYFKMSNIDHFIKFNPCEPNLSISRQLKLNVHNMFTYHRELTYHMNVWLTFSVDRVNTD